MSAIVLFDGVCNFCNGAVNFIIERDKAGYFKFAPLQSEIGVEMINKFAIDPNDTDSVILVENGEAYLHSTAAVRIARHLDRPWNFLFAFVVVPRPLRDLGYKAFAKVRYRLFGKLEVCMMPTPEVRTRFL